MKTKFTYKELIGKQFKLQTDDSEIYLQYVVDEENYVTSPYIATNSIITTQPVNAVEWLSDFDESIEFYVISPASENELERYMSEEEIDEYIKNSKNGK